MSNVKSHPSLIKTLSDTILPNLPFNNARATQDYHRVSLQENDANTVMEQDTGYLQLIGIGSSLAIFASALIIVLTLWSSNERMSYTRVYNDSIVAEFDGWGTSLAWWAEFIGSLDEEKRKTFVSKVFHPSNEDSLQLNIIRFNMGGAPKILPNGTTPNVDFSPFKGIPSMQLSDKTYDWEADAFQLAVIQDILLLNNESLIIEAFSNSPPYWMTKSQNSMGNFDGSDNLDPANYTVFADYISSVIDHAINTLNIPIRYVEPFNEPDFGWKVGRATQEGNHWDQNSMKIFLPILLNSLKAKNLTQIVELSIPDSWSIREALASLNLFDDVVYKANIHGYGVILDENPYLSRLDSSYLSRLDEYVHKVRRKSNINKIWMSESGGYGLGTAGVMQFAFYVINHLNILEAEAWIYWQVLDQTPSWALMLISERYPWWLSQYNYYPANTINFYTMQQFSNHIKKGYRILKTSHSVRKDDCSPVCVIAASSPITSKIKKIIIVILNASPKSIDHDINLSDVMLINNETTVECYRTAEWNGDNHKRVQDKVIIGPKNIIHLSLYGVSVTTIEVF